MKELEDMILIQHCTRARQRTYGQQKEEHTEHKSQNWLLVPALCLISEVPLAKSFNLFDLWYF